MARLEIKHPERVVTHGHRCGEQLNFTRRTECPVCRTPRGAELCRECYEGPLLTNYLKSFYASHGGVDLESLRGGEYVLRECGQCGLIFQEEIPGPELMGKLYERWIDPAKSFEYYKKGRTTKYFVNAAREIGQVHDFLGLSPFQMKVLDFGMGWGNWCLLAKGFGCDVYGAELSPARIANAKRSGINVVGLDDIAQHQFDYIHVAQVFEHIADPRETLKLLVRSVRPGGLLKIGVPNGSDIKRRLSVWDWTAPKGSANSLNPVAPLEHVNCFTLPALLRLTEDAGLVHVAELANAPAAQRPNTLTQRIRGLMRTWIRLMRRIPSEQRAPKQSISVYCRKPS